MDALNLLSASDKVRLPFLGTRDDGDPFQYMLISLESNKAKIALFDWFVNRARLELEEMVDLALPKIVSKELCFKETLKGKIGSIIPDEGMQCVVYEISFAEQIKENFLDGHAALHEKSSLFWKDLLLSIIKDSMLLKFGIKVYLKHLGAYFSRISNYKIKDYSNFRSLLYVDIEKNVKVNGDHLKELYDQLQNNLNKPEDIPLIIDLEKLREMMESELSLTLFDIAFNESGKGKFANLAEVSKYRNAGQYSAYLKAIKNLEQRLYTNYNLIVIIFGNFLHS